jgi:CarD family transcriptional regulator
MWRALVSMRFSPADRPRSLSRRQIVDEEGLKKVFAVLQADDVEEASNWSRRYKANVEASSSSMSLARASSEVRMWRALVSMRFSPADRPRCARRRG